MGLPTRHKLLPSAAPFPTNPASRPQGVEDSHRDGRHLRASARTPAVELVAQTPKIKLADTGRVPRPPQRRRQLLCTTRNRPIAAWSLGASHELGALSVPPLHRYRQVRHQSLCSMSSHHLIARCSPFASSDIQARMAQLLRGCPLRRYGWGWPRTGCGAPRNRSPRADLARATSCLPERSVHNPGCTAPA